jgi:hypothetical protein
MPTARADRQVLWGRQGAPGCKKKGKKKEEEEKRKKKEEKKGQKCNFRGIFEN